MYAVYEFRTNETGIMTDILALKTDNPVYAQNKIFTLAAGAVGSSVYVHTILCVNEHGQPQFGTPMYFEHIPEPEQTPEPEPEQTPEPQPEQTPEPQPEQTPEPQPEPTEPEPEPTEES